MSFNGLGIGLGNVSKLSNARTRSITAENVYGEKGRGGMAELTETPQAEVTKIGQKWDGPNKCARDLGRTWKVRPCITLEPQKVTTLMDVDGPGVILDGVQGQGHYVGVYMAWQQNSSGWRSEGRYLPLQDDIASVAYWYQTEPHGKFPSLADRDGLEVV